MNTTFTECPNCHTQLKSGFLNYVVILDAHKTRLINAVNNTDQVAHCNKCGDALYTQAKSRVTQETEEIQKKIYALIGYIPVVSAQNPLNWQYEVLTMVTGQSTTGTGVLSEFTSSWTDLFGAQSKAYSGKLKAGEQLCFAQLRKQTLDMGGNAVIATDIDYSEVGGDKGMLMVCMAGTAVKLNNPEVLGPNRVEKIGELVKLNARLKDLAESLKES